MLVYSKEVFLGLTSWPFSTSGQKYFCYWRKNATDVNVGLCYPDHELPRDDFTILTANIGIIILK